MPLAKKKRENRHFMKRLTHDELFKLAQEAKIVWEKIRLKDGSKEDERTALIEELLIKLKGHILTLCVKHDASRVIQTCLKYGTEQHRTDMYNELRDGLTDLSKEKYGRVIVKKLFMYCTKPIKAEIIQEKIIGNVRQLMSHKDASNIVEHAYSLVANSQQKGALLSELYGDYYDVLVKTSMQAELAELLEQQPDEAEKVLDGMGEVLQAQVEKGIMQHSIVHKLANVFFTHGSASQKVDMSNHLAEVVIQMLHSRPGALVGLGCVAYGTPKDRKRLVKSMKGYVSKICMEPDGHMLMMSMWDMVDDTVLLREAVLKELCKCFEEILPDRSAQRVLLYLLAPDQARYFPADVVACLKADVPEGASKKDPTKRREELIPHIVPQLMKFCEEHPELLFVPGGPDIMFEVAAKVEDAKGMMEAAATHLAQTNWTELEDEEERKFGYTGAKRLMAAVTVSGESAGFVGALAKALKGKAVQYAVGGGGFLVAALMQHDEAKKALKPELTKGKAQFKGADESTGCQVVVKVLSAK